MLDVVNLERGWSFRRCGDPSPELWVQVDLPHSPFTADLNGRGHWFGVCEYRRTLRLEARSEGARVCLAIGAAMHTAQVFVDGAEVGRHEGGYLPFEVDLSAALKPGAAHELIVRLDNRDNPEVPPGKPWADLDFCWYGGLYRGAELRVYPELHITDPGAAGEVAGGGVFVRTLSASSEEARLLVKVHACNSGRGSRDFQIEVDVLCGTSRVAKSSAAVYFLPGGNAVHVELEVAVPHPQLWSPESPSLYQIQVALRSPDGRTNDRRVVRYGIRRIAFSRLGGFTINGQRRRLRGTNRHQEYPYAGYAVPRTAQYRDARWIKSAGFDYVRLSHYPHSTDFLDACDELGLVVLNCIPGWQYLGGERFKQACFENARQLIRRDRNHASVVAWELSLNETEMDQAFMQQLHAIGHEEYPGDQLFTAGWIDRYDIYLHSRQHGEIHRWRNGDKAMIVAEYGDWEFYAANHGFDQKTGAGVHAAWSNSRHFRGEGERALRQQVWNHLTALNDTLSSPAVLDGQWAMFDYARGYHPLRAACGVMDVFRLPKFSYHFYRSQRDPAEQCAGLEYGPMVFIASHWTVQSDLRVIVFSNCEEVELSLNGASFGRKKPERTALTQFLPHPPFVFDLPQFVSGTLEATGWIGGVLSAHHQVGTPGAPAGLGLLVDTTGLPNDPATSDLLIVQAQIQDQSGQLCVQDESPVAFSLLGQGEILGPSTVVAEAGIAAVILRLPAGATQFVLQAQRTIGSPLLSTAAHWKNGQLLPWTEDRRAVSSKTRDRVVLAGSKSIPAQPVAGSSS